MAHGLQYMNSTLMQKRTKRYMYYASCARYAKTLGNT